MKNDQWLLVMVWLLNSQATKNCKSTESFCLSILTIYTNIGPFLTCLLLPFLFISARFLNICKPRTTFHLLWRAGPPELAFYGSGLAFLQAGWEWWMQAGLVPYNQKFSVNEMYDFSKLTHQTGCYFTWVAHSIKPAPYLATFACSRMLVCMKCCS